MRNKKEIVHNLKSCGGLFQVEYEDGIPYLLCDKCNKKVDDWIKWTKEYSKFWQIAEKWTSKKDHLMCLMGFFAKLYNDYYNVEFTFSLHEKGLFHGPEVQHIRKVYRMFDGDILACKAYLEWVFKFKVLERKKKITSLGFLAVPGLINEFKLYQKNLAKITRDTPIPDKIIQWVKHNMPTLLDNIALVDHGDLHTLLSHYKNNRLGGLGDVSLFINKLLASGYVDSSFKIRNWSE